MQYNLKKFNICLNIRQIANVHYFEFSNNYHTLQDRHNFNELIYVDNGHIDVEADNFKGRIKQQQLIIHGANEFHSLSSDSQTAPNVIIIGFECDCRELSVFSKAPVALTQSEQAILSEIIKESRSVFLPPYDIPNYTDMKKKDSYPFGADQLIKNLLEYLLIKIIRTKETTQHRNDLKISSQPQLLLEVQTYIKNNIEQKLNIGELCFLHGTNKTTLCALFKQHLNCTIMDYVNNLKVHMAKIKMRKGTENFTQIGESLNFSSVHYFSKVFKQYEKLTPSQYIKTIKSKFCIDKQD